MTDKVRIPTAQFFVCQNVKDSLSLQRSINHSPHVIELHPSRGTGIDTLKKILSIIVGLIVTVGTLWMLSR
jgi:hypothetical protein